MEGKKASIRYRKANGTFGPVKVLQPNEIFVIGSEDGCDIRLYKIGRFCRHVFELNNRGLVTLTDESLHNTDSTDKRVFHQDESVQIEGKTFCVQYQSVEAAALLVAETSKTQQMWRRSFAPTFGSSNVQTEDNVVSSRQSKQYYTSEVVMKTPRRPSTSVESARKSSTPVTSIPARNTPSARRSMMQRPSMAMLAEEDESNSNDSKYKTPENTTPKIVMRSHKSSVKSHADGDDTPKCVTPLSNTKIRRSLLQYDDSDTHSSDEESSVKRGVVRIIDTSNSDSGSDDDDELPALDINEETSDAQDTDYDSPERGRRAKRGHDDLDDDYDDDVEQDIEPPKKRMKRETVHSFRKQRKSSITDAHQVNISTGSKKSSGRVSNLEASQSSFASLSASAKINGRTVVAPNTVPRLKQSHQQRTLRQSLSAFQSADAENGTLHDFEEYADNSPSPPLKPSEFTLGDDANNSDTTHSSSFSYISGKDAERASLGMSVFYTEQSDVANAASGDLMDFSIITASRKSGSFERLPGKQQICQRRSSRAIKPVEVFTPEKYNSAPRTPKKTPIRKGILKESRPSALVDTTVLIDTSMNLKTATSLGRYTKKTPDRKVVSEELSEIVDNLINTSNISELSLRASRPQTSASSRKTIKNTLVTKGVLYDTLPSAVSIDKSIRSETPASLRRSSRPVTPTLFRDYVVPDRTPGRKSRSGEDLLTVSSNDSSIDVLNNTSLSGEALFETNAQSATKLHKTSRTPAKTPKNYAGDSLSEMRKRRVSSRTPLPLYDTSVVPPLIESNKSTNKKEPRTPKRTPAKSLKAKLFIDSNESFADVGKSNGPRTPLSRVNAALIEDSSGGNIKKVLSISRTSQRTSANQTNNNDVTYESDDSFIENKSTPYPRSSANKIKKTPKLSNTFESSLLSDDCSPIENSLMTNKSMNQNKMSVNLKALKNIAISNGSTPMKSSNLFDESMLRRSCRTPKSVFRTNSILDESIFDTSTKQTEKSMRRSYSMGNSLSSSSKCSDIRNDNSSIRSKDVSTTLSSKLSLSLRKLPLSVEAKSYIDIEGSTMESKRGRGRPKKNTSPSNDLTNVQGVEKLLATPKVQKGPMNDLSDFRGVKSLLKTPKIRKEPKNDLTNVQGVEKLLATPKVQKGPLNDLSDVPGVKNLLRTPKVRNEPKNDLTNVRGVKKLLGTPKVPKEPMNDLSDIRGVKSLLKTPNIRNEPKNDLTNVRGVKKLLGTPKVQKEPMNDLSDVRGVKGLLKTPKIRNEPKNDLTNVQGVKKLFGTPKVQKEPMNDLSDVRGVKSLFKTPKIRNEPKNDLTNVQGVKELFSFNKMSKKPRNSLSDVSGVRHLLKTPRPNKEPLNDLTDVIGVRNLLGTPEEKKRPKDDPTNVEEVKPILGTLKIGNEPTNVEGVKKLMKTPRKRKMSVPDLFDNRELDDEILTSTTNSVVPAAVEVSPKKPRTRRGRAAPVEICEEPVLILKRTRAKRAEPPRETVEDATIEKPTPKSRTTKRMVVAKEAENNESSLPTKRKRPIKKQLLTDELLPVEDIPIKPARKTRTIKNKVVVDDVLESSTTTTIQKKPNKKQVQDDKLSVKDMIIKPSPKTRTTKKKEAAKLESTTAIKTRKRPITKQKSPSPTQFEDEEIEQLPVKPTRRNIQKRSVKEVQEVSETYQVEEVSSTTPAKKRGRQPKAKPVDEDVEEDTVFTSVEEIDNKAPGKAVRVTRARRGRPDSQQTEESYDIESADNFTTVEVKKTAKSRSTKTTKRVQFDSSPAPTIVKQKMSRRLLTEEDIDQMTEAVAVAAPLIRKSARTRK